jgi:hypothetical protein
MEHKKDGIKIYGSPLIHTLEPSNTTQRDSSETVIEVGLVLIKSNT